MILDDIHRDIKKNKKRKRIGRGPGSGHGKTSGRGHKGYFSRAGSSLKRGFAGGQTPLFMRVAKRGFSNAYFQKRITVVNVRQLNEFYEDGGVVDPESLKKKALAFGRFEIVKVLGDGELSKKLTVKAHRFSKSAEEKITKAGGTIERLEKPVDSIATPDATGESDD
ncbi:50S ribosomal protein L15 [Stratiformator vulcanicus]|uniref:Large ribosomal subunit protein uL15 n=1 Tax=Stratiformator vulcanicus TaxID=2527980 RepID=A0A517R0S3_9PLAN|nr:50S ribosomal protein L15 [Stratiformator vulcanicus]QDT37507.1 50S ribosomal protein L15 [Stratiformator vulcanicus]